jgi:hypothetical protein
MNTLLLVKADMLDIVLVKAKYKRRWRGPDGKWQYSYDEPHHGLPHSPQDGKGFKTQDLAKWLSKQPGIKVVAVNHSAITLEGEVKIGLHPTPQGAVLTVFDTFGHTRPAHYQTRSMGPGDSYQSAAVSLDWLVDDLRSGRAERLRAQGYNLGPAAYRSWRATSYKMSA